MPQQLLQSSERITDMQRYQVEITNEALEDMEQLYEYIADILRAPETAMKQYNRIADEIMKLDIYPERFRLIELPIEQTKQLRRMPVDNYSVFYVVHENRVIVTNVLYSASSIEDRL